tara:strand:+ start:351 stop:551 length:201 start_codon:yes stop_codon:yes gene_type:complete
MKKLFIIFFLFSGCSFANVGYFEEKNEKKSIISNKFINFENDYSTIEYKKLLEKYSEDNDYPNMNK